MVRDNVKHHGSEEVSRRRFVYAAGVGGIAGIAGCIGEDGPGNGDDDPGTTGDDDPESTGGDDEPEDGDPVDPQFTKQTWVVPQDVEFNTFSVANVAGEINYNVFEPLLLINEFDEVLHFLVEDWSSDGTTFALAVADGFSWHDGTTVTAEDVARQLKIEVYLQEPLSNHVSAENIEAVDENTVELELDAPYSEDVILGVLDGTILTTHEEFFGEFLDRFEDAEADEEVVEVQGDLMEDLSIGPDEMIGLGPWEFERATERIMELSPFDDHPNAENYNFSEFGHQHIDHAEEGWRALQSGEVDGLHTWFTPPEVLEEYPDWIHEHQVPANWGMGLTFNHDHEHFGQIEVRKAIAHVLDREFIAEGSDPRTKASVSVPSGIPGEVQEYPSEWLGDLESQFDPYTGGPDAATELLEEVGYGRDDGTWVDDGGEPVEAEVMVPVGFTDWVSACEVIVAQLDEFGFVAELRQIDVSTYFAQFPDGNYGLATDGWTSGDVYPYFTLRHLLDNPWFEDGLNWDPDDVQVPPIEDPDGAPESVDVAESLDALAQADEEEEERRLVRELAWVVNQTLPLLPVQEKFEQLWLTSQNWHIPDDFDDYDSMQHAMGTYLLLREGHVNPRLE